jgi:hypothetical protein
MKITIAALVVSALILPGGALTAQAPTNMQYNGWKRDRPTQLGTISPEVWIRMDTVSAWVLVPGTPQEVFRKAQYVYGSLKIKVTHADSVSGILGNTGLKNTGGFAGQRMSYWLGCGESMTGPNADRWRVTMAILSSVEPASKDTTKLRTVIIATARNMAEGSAVPSNCNSTGKLEEEIHKKVQAMPATISGSE